MSDPNPENPIVETVPSSTESSSQPVTSEDKPLEPAVPDSPAVPDTRVLGMNLNTSLGGLTTNMVALACQHKAGSTSSSVLNNFEKDVLSYTAIKLIGTSSDDIDKLNISSSESLDDNVKYSILDSKNNRNLTEMTTNQSNGQQLFATIKKAISSDMAVDSGALSSSKRDDIKQLTPDLQKFSGLSDIKFAAIKNACTQIVFGFEMDGDEVSNVVGRLQSVGAGSTGAVQTGDFKMTLTDGKYIISAVKDTGLTVIKLLKKILGLNKDVEFEDTTPSQETTPVVEDKNEEEEVIGGTWRRRADNELTNPRGGGKMEPDVLGGGRKEVVSGGKMVAYPRLVTGGKTKHRRHKKKGTRKHKPKRTMKKHKRNHKKTHKK